MGREGFWVRDYRYGEPREGLGSVTLNKQSTHTGGIQVGHPFGASRICNRIAP